MRIPRDREQGFPRDREHLDGVRGKVFTIVEKRSRCVERCRRLGIDLASDGRKNQQLNINA